MSSQWVIFELGNEEYGMPISVVKEITRLEDVRPIPQAPYYVKGLINLRGSAIPLIDLHIRFGGGIRSEEKDDLASLKESYALITEVDGEAIGFAVDQVREVRVIEEIEPSPPLVTAPFIGGVVNLTDRIIMVLVPEKILGKEELAGIAQLLS